MTLCRKCGKEIPDGQEMCEECQEAEVKFDESYLDELMQSMEQDIEEREPVAERPLEAPEEQPVEELLEELEMELDEMTEAIPEESAKELMEEPVEEPMEEPEELPEEEAEEEPVEEPMEEPEELPEEEAEEEPVEEPMEEPEELPMEEPVEELTEEPMEELEELPVEEPMEEPVEESVEEPTEESLGDEDIGELLEMLSKDYEEYDESSVGEEPKKEEMPEDLDESPAEATLFREDDEGGEIFADDLDALSVDDIFDDALSAVDYSEAEEEPLQEEILEEFISPEEESSEGFEDMALDSLALDDSDMSLASEEELGEQLADKSETAAVPKRKKPSIWKRVFGNIITEQSAEEEAKEREKEQANAEEKALAREEKKKQSAEEKAEKAEQAKLEKEKKAAEKAEKAAVKAAEKEEKKRLKVEMEAQEVVGRINPLGASIVMVFFGLICVLVILGSQSLSYTSSVHNAESSFVERNYKDAYEALAGVEVSESSKEMKEKVRMCMQLQRQLDAYHNYYEMKMYLESLDSLIKGIRSYDTNKGKAEEYEMLGQYNELEGRLASQLYDEFGVSESQARSIISAKNQEEYTSRLENIIAQWEKRNKEDER